MAKPVEGNLDFQKKSKILNALLDNVNPITEDYQFGIDGDELKFRTSGTVKTVVTNANFDNYGGAGGPAYDNLSESPYGISVSGLLDVSAYLNIGRTLKIGYENYDYGNYSDGDNSIFAGEYLKVSGYRGTNLLVAGSRSVHSDPKAGDSIAVTSSNISGDRLYNLVVIGSSNVFTDTAGQNVSVISSYQVKLGGAVQEDNGDRSDRGNKYCSVIAASYVGYPKRDGNHAIPLATHAAIIAVRGTGTDVPLISNTVQMPKVMIGIGQDPTPIYADNAAAANLPVGHLFRTATGDLKVKY